MKRAVNNRSIAAGDTTENVLNVGVGLEVSDLSGIQAKLAKAMEQVAARSGSAADVDLVGAKVNLSLGAARGDGLGKDRLHPKTGEKNDERK